MRLARVAGGSAEVQTLRRVLPAGLIVSTADPSAWRAPTASGLHAAGQRAARDAMRALGVIDPVAPGRGWRGCPSWSNDVVGSIAHKDELALAVVGRSDHFAAIGVDLEDATPLPAELATVVLTPWEAAQARAGRLDARLVFTAKEAYYKWYCAAGGADEPGFTDLGVRVRDHHVEVSGPGWPTVTGVQVSGARWLLVCLWSSPSTTVFAPSSMLENTTVRGDLVRAGGR